MGMSAVVITQQQRTFYILLILLILYSLWERGHTLDLVLSFGLLVLNLEKYDSIFWPYARFIWDSYYL